MFIHVVYKDPPELSLFRRSMTLSEESDLDESVDKDLLVNPICPVRVMLEFIRKRCKLGTFAVFDLCDDSGHLKGFFHLPTWTYPTDHLIHRKTYFIIVIKVEAEKKIILPQLNRQHTFYRTLLDRVTRFVSSGEVTSVQMLMGRNSSGATAATKTRSKRKNRSSEVVLYK